MEIWKHNRNGGWQKRKSHAFTAPIAGNLHAFLRGVKSRKRTSGPRFVVFDNTEARELERITAWFIDGNQYKQRVCWDSVVRFLRLVLEPLPFATAKLISPYSCKKEVNGEPAAIRCRIELAIEIN